MEGGVGGALDPRELRQAVKRALGAAGRVLAGFGRLGERHLLAVDGTGYFSSPTLHCELLREGGRDGSEYYVDVRHR